MTEDVEAAEHDSCRVGKGAPFARRAHQSVSLGKVVGTLRFAYPMAAAPGQIPFVVGHV